MQGTYGATVNYLLVSTLATLCYINSLRGDFVFDDNEAIIQNSDINPVTPLSNVFRNDFWGTDIFDKNSHKSYRPLTIVTFRWNYWLGELDPFGYHVLNVLLQAIVSAVFLKVCLCLDNDWRRSSSSLTKEHSQFALLAAILFAVHPIHTETVAGIVGRAELSSALCYLLGFIIYRGACIHGDISTIETLLKVMSSVVFAGCAMLFKEQGVTVIGVCLCYDILSMKLDLYQLCQKQVPQHSASKWRMFVLRVCILVLSAVILIAGRMSTGAPSFKPVDNPASFQNSTISRLMNYSYLYSLNTWLLLNPWWLCFDWSMGCVPLITTFTDKRIFVVFFFWIGFAILSLYCLCARPSTFKQLTTISFAMLVVPFLPASNILLHVGFVLAERVLYLPSFGFCLLVSLGVVNLRNYCQNIGKQICTILVLFLIVTFSTRSINRSSDWYSEDVLFTSGLRVCPLNAKVLYNIGKVKTDKGNIDLGEKAYRKAISLFPQYDQALNNLGNLLEGTSRHHEAERMLYEAVTVNPSFAAAWMNLGIVQASLNKTKEAESSYKKALQHRKNYPDAYYNLGNLYIASGQTTEAILALKNTIHLQNDHQNAWNNLGLLYENLGMYKEAESTLRAATNVMSDNPQFYYSLGVLMGRVQNFEEGERLLLRALEMNPMSAKFHANLGVIYHLQKQYDIAKEYYQRALNLDPNLETAVDNLRKLTRSGKTQQTK